MSELDLLSIGGLFLVSVVAGCCDAIAGGGGLLTVPALMLAGLNPVAAIATNKLQGSAGTVSATLAFARKGLIDWRIALPIGGSAFIAGILGALSVNLLPKPFVSGVVPFILIGIALYFALAPKMTNADAKARISIGMFALTVAPLIGFYDGIFGPGGGSFYMAAFVSLLGFGVVRATAHTKMANAASNLGGLLLFASAGSIYWAVGFVMAIGAFTGAQIGSILAIRIGVRLIRPLLVTISCLMAIRLLFAPTNPVGGFLARSVSTILN
ncbi:TSUP family transporter [Sphingomonadaceae bacterium jetA1]|jgi:uncharacterized membrane protein YfcA|uniref:TSUP family transporter n=1 Tax=Facivitalis istanbulensis TaxID=3075838 RepID=UPI0034907B2F